MIFHVSIAAEQPRRVAGVLAELWGGVALPFPPVKGAWVAMAGDARNSLVEVLPLGVELVEQPGDADAAGRLNPDASRTSATHVAIATPLAEGEVLAIAARECWSAKYRKREGRTRDDGVGFGVIELWIENRLLVEVLPAEMQRQYLDAATIPAWRAMLAAHELSLAA